METILIAAILGNALAWCFDPIQDLKSLIDWRKGGWFKRKVFKLTNCPSCIAWWVCFPIGYYHGEGWKTILLAVCAHTLASLLGRVK